MDGDAEYHEDRLLGRVLSRRWTLERVIGVGGSATVYAASHHNGTRVAIKVLHRSLQKDALVRGRFLQEGYIANRIGVPQVVNVIDDGRDGDIVYLVMELLEGASVETLRERAGGRLAAADVVELGCRLLAVLEAAHSRGVIHGDIKPSNLFRTVAPVGLKVLDFGTARIRTGRGRHRYETAGRDGEWCVGTPAFMAPEQARGPGERLDERTDLWAVGATLFSLLTGEQVHPGCSTTEILQAASQQPARQLKEMLPRIRPELAALVDRALAFESGARFASASAMKKACAECGRSLAALGEHSSLFDTQVGSVSRTEPRAGFWSGRLGRLWWFHYTGPCTQETWRQYLELVQRMLNTTEVSTLLCMAHQADAPSAIQRKQLAEFVQENRHELRHLDRFALVVDAVAHRHAITAINYLVRKPFSERVFNSPLAAIRWLTENHPDLQAEMVRTAIVNQVPRYSLWSCLRSEEATTVRKTVFG
jgi:serine/threonine protein kinase